MIFQKIFKQRIILSYSNQNFINNSFKTRFNIKTFSNQLHTAAKETFFVDSSENIKIEVSHYLPVKKTNYPPILFIHGGFLAAWSWDNFSQWFSNKGHECYALSFRGNGQSTKTPNRDKWWKLKELANDISVVTDDIITRTKDKPILVGHSMGGGILQKYLQDNHQKVSGGILFASVSPLLYKTSIFSTLTRKPDFLLIKSLLTLNPYLYIETPELMKKALFSSAYPDSMAKEIHPKLDKTCSVFAILEFLRPFVDPSKIKCPMIVIGAGEDALEDNIKHLEEIAEVYGVGYDIIDGSGHEIMLDLKWEFAANVIFDRIQERIVNKK
ncbi:Alpha/Beta hydrolase protein [Glomus cerebriforme]|uniref:Alpha/Beta hydrolase protein n=1 Tax=Glomus cerebriforme TaxID=658196 RepID=A0A397SHP1_9GLOM|nr:Alpha/Beta hydrolase protein [Glomus cerebriforme]